MTWTFAPSIELGLTLVIMRPDTKVTKDPPGTSLAPVSMTDEPAIGGEQYGVADAAGACACDVGFPSPQPGSGFVICDGTQLGSSQVQTEPSTMRDGKAVNGSAAFVDGQAVMNEAASVKTELGSSGVP